MTRKLRVIFVKNKNFVTTSIYVTLKKYNILPIDQDCEPKQSVDHTALTRKRGAHNYG